MDMIRQLIDAIHQASAPKTSAYDTPARVIRVENGVAWVHIPGGVAETPVRLTIDAKAGDTVQVRVGGGQAWLTGNVSAPPTDDSTADRVAAELEEAKDAIFRAIQAVSILTRHLTVSDRDGNVIADFDADQHLANIAGWTAEHGILSTVVDDPTIPTVQRYIALNALTGDITVQKREKATGTISGDIVISKDAISFGTYQDGSLWYRSSLSLAKDGQRGTFLFESGAPSGGQIGIGNYDNAGHYLYTGDTGIDSIGDGTVTGAISALSSQTTITVVNGWDESPSGNERLPIASVTLEKGKYILFGTARFQYVADGWCCLLFSWSGSTGAQAISRFAINRVPTSDTEETWLQVMYPINIGTDGTSVYLHGQVSSSGGGDIVSTGITVVALDGGGLYAQS